jgi:hypothetical protein
MLFIKSGEKGENFVDLQKVGESGRLELDSDLFAEFTVDFLTPVEDLAGGRRKDSFDHLESRRFAGAVRSEKTEAGPTLDR